MAIGKEIFAYVWLLGWLVAAVLIVRYQRVQFEAWERNCKASGGWVSHYDYQSVCIPAQWRSIHTEVKP